MDALHQLFVTCGEFAAVFVVAYAVERMYSTVSRSAIEIPPREPDAAAAKAIELYDKDANGS